MAIFMDRSKNIYLLDNTYVGFFNNIYTLSSSVLCKNRKVFFVRFDIKAIFFKHLYSVLFERLNLIGYGHLCIL